MTNKYNIQLGSQIRAIKDYDTFIKKGDIFTVVSWDDVYDEEVIVGIDLTKVSHGTAIASYEPELLNGKRPNWTFRLMFELIENKSHFKIGETVICIDAKGIEALTYGKKYIITDIYADSDLVKIKGKSSGYYARRFKTTKQPRDRTKGNEMIKEYKDLGARIDAFKNKYPNDYELILKHLLD